MPRNTGGTYTLAAGNPVSAGTTILDSWANDTLADIASALTASLDRNGNGGMMAKLKLIDGSNSVPALCFTNDVTSGLWLIAGGLGLGAANTLCVGLTSSSADVYPLATFHKGAVATQSTTNGKGVEATGNGTGAGVVGTGGATGQGGTFTAGGGNAAGLVATGAGTGDGLKGTGGSSAGVGVEGVGGAGGGTGVVGTGTGSGGFGGVFTGGTNSAGVVATGGSGTSPGVSATGAGTGAGIAGTGGSSAGSGVEGTGGAAGVGVKGTGGSTSGVGVQGIGTGTGAGGSFTAGTAASGGTPSAAAELNSGYLKFTSTTAPSSGTAVAGYVTPISPLAAWGRFTTDGAGNVTIDDAMNVASASISAGTILVTFASAFANANYAVTPGSSIASAGGVGVGPVVVGQTTTTFNLGLDKATGTGQSLATTACTLHFHAAGRQ